MNFNLIGLITLIALLILTTKVELGQCDLSCGGSNCGVTTQTDSSKDSCIKQTSGSLAELGELFWGTDSIFTPQVTGSCLAPHTEESDQEKINACLYAYNITGIGITLVDNKYQLFIRFTVFSYSSCQFLLSLRSLTETSSPTSCKYYDIQQSKAVTFTDECLIELVPASTYDLNITNIETGFLRIFRFFTPTQLSADTENAGQASTWRPLIAITIHEGYITVHIQNLPRSRNSYYVLQLRYTNSKGIQLEGRLSYWLGTSDESVTWHNPGAGPGNLYILKCENQPKGDRYSDPNDSHNCRSQQHYSIDFSEVLTSQPNLSATETMASSTTDDNVVSRSKSDKGPQIQELYILIGTICGVIFLALVVFVILFLYFRRRQGSGALTTRFSGGNIYSDDVLFEEDLKGLPPTVLLLYSYDCQQHLACVQSLALLLQNALGCSVMADFWATQEIAERGIHMWLQHKIATANYVIVVCSTGARFKSVATRRALLDETADDAYVAAMEMLQSRADTGGNQKLAVYFDYSGESDVPVLLENWQRYRLMQDVHSLISTILDIYTKGDGAVNKSTTEHEQIYIDTLQEKINTAKTYMLNKPDWFHANLQPSLKNNHTGQDSTQNTSSSKPLALVTVERNRHRSNSPTSEVQLDKVDGGVRNSNTRVLCPPINSLASLQIHKPVSPVNTGVCSLSLYSSSLEDLEHDINFILHPSLPNKSIAFSTAHHVSGFLPEIYPSGNDTSSTHAADIPQIPMLKRFSKHHYDYSSLDSDTSSQQGSSSGEGV